MKVLVTGSRGQLGREIVKMGEGLGWDVDARDRNGLDIRNQVDLERITPPYDFIINCAAHTRVDLAESEERDSAWGINAMAPGILAQTADRIGATLIHISTDYVFDGTSRTPYHETSPTNPRSEYGQSKLAGEIAVRDALPHNHYIVRTSWVYGKYGKNFVSTMLDLAHSRPEIEVVADQVGQPTWTRDLANGIASLVAQQPAHGTYHFSGEGSCSWFEFAQEIFRAAHLDPRRIKATTSDKFVRPAPRPAYSVLSHENWIRAGLRPPLDWQTALSIYLAEVQPS